METGIAPSQHWLTHPPADVPSGVIHPPAVALLRSVQATTDKELLKELYKKKSAVSEWCQDTRTPCL